MTEPNAPFPHWVHPDGSTTQEPGYLVPVTRYTELVEAEKSALELAARVEPIVDRMEQLQRERDDLASVYTEQQSRVEEMAQMSTELRARAITAEDEVHTLREQLSAVRGQLDRALPFLLGDDPTHTEGVQREEGRQSPETACEARWRVVVHMLLDPMTGASQVILGHWETGEIDAESHLLRLSYQFANSNDSWQVIAHGDTATMVHVEDIDYVTIEKES